MISNPSSQSDHISNLAKRVAADVKQLRTDVSEAVLTANNVALDLSGRLINPVIQFLVH